MRISRGKSDSLVKFNYKIDGMRGLILAVTHRTFMSEANKYQESNLCKCLEDLYHIYGYRKPKRFNGRFLVMYRSDTHTKIKKYIE